MPRLIRIAVAQYEPRIGDLDHNLAAAVSWAERAAVAGADLIVLPELASSGYVLHSEAEADALAETTTGATVSALQVVAAEHSTHIVCGLLQRDGNGRRNAAVLIGPEGVVAGYSKLHLFYDEQTWFERGEGLVVVQLPWGRLGMMICYDLWFPEVARAMALAGADVIAVPTNWVGSFKDTLYDEGGRCQGDYVAIATAAQNGVVMACADRVGVERGVKFLGASIIVGADGWPVAGPAHRDHEQLLTADVDLDSVAGARQRTPRNHLHDDRDEARYGVRHVAAAATPPV